MTNLLVIAASANGHHSASAKLALDFAASRKYDGLNSEFCILSDDPPPPLDREFVTAAFTAPDARTAGMRAHLQYSDNQIDRLRRADVLVIATPMYNFGMPGLLKSWFDQVIRPGETFATTGNPEAPYRGLLAIEECVVITTRGSHGLSPAGVAAGLNFLDPHLAALLQLIGVEPARWFDSAGLDECAGMANEILTRTREAIMAC